jgi:hypothetical protein
MQIYFFVLYQGTAFSQAAEVSGIEAVYNLRDNETP